jgi:predicted phage terminase large subunit-like protein
MAKALDPTVIISEAKKLFPLLPETQRLALEWRMKWLMGAHAHQIEPVGDWWTIWLLLAGRGAGKTRCAAEWTAWESWTHAGTRSLVSAPTASDIRDTCFEGDSGLLSVIPEKLIQDYNRSLSEIIMINGSLIKGIAASEPDRLRGGQWHRCWCDELAAWQYGQEAMDMIMFALRLGTSPKLIATTTPKPKQFIRDLANREGDDVVLTRASTMTNLSNLAPTFRDQIMQYEGTNLFRQEALAELIDPEEQGLVKRSWFELWPNDRALPQFEYVIQSYDCATSDKTVNDPTACVVLGIFRPNPDKPMSAMLIDCWSEHLRYPELRKRVIEEYSSVYGDENEFGNGKKTDIVLVEDKSAGISLIQDIQRAGVMVRAYNPGRADKVQRFSLVAPLIQRGRVYLPESSRIEGAPRDWVEPFLNQVCSFPESNHDDYVDALSQALRLLRDMGLLNIDPVVIEEDWSDYDRPVRENPYAV